MLACHCGCIFFIFAIFENMNFSDITPAYNTNPGRTMLMPVGGVDPSSTRTFLPMAFQTTDGIYNTKLAEVDNAVMNKVMSKDYNTTLPVGKVEELVEADIVDEMVEKEGFRRLKRTREGFDKKPCSCGCPKCAAIKRAAMMNDQLGSSASKLNTHVMDTDSTTTKAVDKLFNDYVKNNEETQPLGTHLLSETSDPVVGEIVEDNREGIIMGNGKVLVKEGEKKPEEPWMSGTMILIIIMILLTLVYLIYFTKLLSVSNSNVMNAVNRY